MGGIVSDCDAIEQTAVFLNHFSDLPDPRQRGKAVCPLDEVLLFIMATVLAGDLAERVIGDEPGETTWLVPVAHCDCHSSTF